MKLGATRICTSARSVNARAGSSHYRLICPTRSFHSSILRSKEQLDPRLEDLGKVIRDEYAVVRDSYGWFLLSAAQMLLIGRIA